MVNFHHPRSVFWKVGNACFKICPVDNGVKILAQYVQFTLNRRCMVARYMYEAEVQGGVVAIATETCTFMV